MSVNLEVVGDQAVGGGVERLVQRHVHAPALQLLLAAHRMAALVEMRALMVLLVLLGLGRRGRGRFFTCSETESHSQIG